MLILEKHYLCPPMERLCKNNFEDFVLTNSILFYSFAKRYVKDRSVIEDIIQDCFVKLWDNINNIEYIADVKLYMFGMIKYAALNHLKRNQKIDYKDILDDNVESSIDFFNDILEAESNNLIVKAIAKLPHTNSLVIRLSLKGYRNFEIASMLNLSEDAVKSQKKRAIKKITSYCKHSFLFLS